jgi:hypothetical protein
LNVEVAPVTERLPAKDEVAVEVETMFEVVAVSKIVTPPETSKRELVIVALPPILSAH